MPPLLQHYGFSIYDGYLGAGLIYVALYAHLAWLWSDHLKPKKTKKADSVPEESPADRLHQAITQRYWDHHTHTRDSLRVYCWLIVKMGCYTAVLSVVRDGYMRMLNLRALEMQTLSKAEVGRLVAMIFAVSIVFFWLADVSTSDALIVKRNERTMSRGIGQMPRRSRILELWDQLRLGRMTAAVEPVGSNRGKVYAGLCSFAFLGASHTVLGLAEETDGLFFSAILFGFGQAISTGLGTIWKDEVRDVVRRRGANSGREKEVISCIGGIHVTLTIVNSMVTGFLGNTVGIRLASFFYSFLAVLGFVYTFFLWNGTPEVASRQTPKALTKLNQAGVFAHLLSRQPK
eukprot:TRINITY_DN33229_c0_g1_i2.p1 TRINITY_DN33229_c0_g1~~TRINITY_DN33229_c0_g1_i2.p1  ORF type:complete len:382 (-),score=31.39 TRINITY_DN33229_c0_g1_i2:69-1106(-)